MQARKRAIVIRGVTALAAIVCILGAVSRSIAPAPAEEIDTLMEGPSPEEMPFFEDDFSNLPYPPSRELPSTGVPHLRATELYTIPKAFNQVNYNDEQWLQAVLDNKGEQVRMDEKSLDEFYSYHERVDNKIIYFQVSFPDDAVKYYSVRYNEVP
jgi:hypothetical protein